MYGDESQAMTGAVIIEERNLLIQSLEKRMKRLMHGDFPRSRKMLH